MESLTVEENGETTLHLWNSYLYIKHCLTSYTLDNGLFKSPEYLTRFVITVFNFNPP